MEQAAKRKAKRAKAARIFSEEKAKKFKITLVVSWVNRTTYSVLQVTIYDMYEVVLLLYVEMFDGDNVNGQVKGDYKIGVYSEVPCKLEIYYCNTDEFHM
nr:hypothetical protein CFP56_08668 [Quercus suber]